MTCRSASAFSVVIALALSGITGCATTARSDPPPEVAPQPQPTTAREAVTEEAATARQDTEDAATAEAAEAAEAPAAVAVPTPTTRSQRFRPTTRSTQEIRELSAAAPLALDFEQRLDQAHDRIYAWGQGLFEATDRGLAASDRPMKPVPAAPFRLATIVELLDRADGLQRHVHLDFDIALRLPNIEQRLRLFVTSAELDGGARDRAEQSRLRAGLRYQLLHNLDFDVGIRVDLPPVAFASVIWSREYPLGSWDFYPLAKLFAETKESAGYAFGATFDRWSGRQLLRSSSFAKWRHDRDQTAWSQTFVYARANELIVPDRYGSYISADDIGRGWGLKLVASGENTDKVTRYQSGLFYRNRTPLRWLYWSVEPFARWDRAWNWNADPGIRIGIDALFWDLARPAK